MNLFDSWSDFFGFVAFFLVCCIYALCIAAYVELNPMSAALLSFVPGVATLFAVTLAQVAFRFGGHGLRALCSPSFWRQ